MTPRAGSTATPSPHTSPSGLTNCRATAARASYRRHRITLAPGRRAGGPQTLTRRSEGKQAPRRRGRRGNRLSKTSSQAASDEMRIVRKRLADGTVKEYRYPRKAAAKAPRIAAGTLDALLLAYRASPEWKALRPASRATYATYLRVFDHRGDLRVEEVNRRLLLAARDAIATTRGNGAANGFLNTAAALFAWAVDREWVPVSPAANVKRLPGGHIKPWTEADLARALAAVPEEYRRVLLLAAHIGQRRGDLVLPVHAELRQEFGAWRDGAPDDARILVPPRAAAWQPNHLSDELKRVLVKAGLPGLSVHGLRKLAATRLAEAGCSNHEINSILGWRTLAMADLYTRSAEQKRLAQSAAGRLETSRVKPPGNGR